MAKVSAGLRKQLLRRRAVQVNAVLVGKDELHEAEGIVRSGLLTDCEATGAQLREHCIANGPVSNDLSAKISDFKTLTGNVVSVLLDGRNDLAAEDAGWDVPVRTEDDVPHVLGEHRRLMAEGLAHHYVHAQRDLVIAGKYAQHKLRHIHDDGRLRKLGRQPAPTLQCVLQLADAHGERQVQLTNGAFAQLAVGIEAVARLKEFDRVDQWAGVPLRIWVDDHGGRKVSEQLQSLGELAVSRVGIAGCDCLRHIGNRRPVSFSG